VIKGVSFNRSSSGILCSMGVASSSTAPAWWIMQSFFQWGVRQLCEWVEGLVRIGFRRGWETVKTWSGKFPVFAVAGGTKLVDGLKLMVFSY